MNEQKTGVPLLEVKDLKVWFPAEKPGLFKKEKSFVRAVDGVSFQIQQGDTLALVGESGCGKSTLGRAVVGLNRPTSGVINFNGKPLNFDGSENERKAIRREMQLIFQDPFSSLNPRMKVIDLIGRPLEVLEHVNQEEKTRRVADLLHVVGLQPEVMYRFPHEFSGGQKQRISVARALAVNPKFIVADEPTAALDVSVQCQILNLLMDLRNEFGLTMMFISHDLDVVRYISDHIAVMYLGVLVEYGTTKDIFSNPVHPYTKALLSAVPLGPEGRGRKRERLSGSVGNPMCPPTGCRLHPRCSRACEACSESLPAMVDIGGGHYVACSNMDYSPEIAGM